MSAAVRRFRVDDSEVSAVLVETVDDLRALRALEDWHEGAVALLTYPTADPVAFVSHDNPKYFGRAVHAGEALVKGPAGDFAVLPIPTFMENASEVSP